MNKVSKYLVTSLLSLSLVACSSKPVEVNTIPVELKDYSLAYHTNPESEKFPDYNDYTNKDTGELDSEGYQKQYDLWLENKRNKEEKPLDVGSIHLFTKNSMKELLNNSNNTVYSPVNIYMALCLLAKTSDDRTRQEILDVLNMDYIENAQSQAQAIYFNHYSNDGLVTCLLGNSIWLNNDISYNQELLNTLCQDYYTSSFSGKMGSEEYNNALRTWVNEQTGGLLEDKANKLQMTPQTMMNLVSTILYKGGWTNKFNPNLTAKDVFHGVNGNSEVDFMNTQLSTHYFWQDHFSSVSLPVSGDGQMWLILPDQGVKVTSLLEDDSLYDFISNGYKNENSKRLTVNLSVPKFDVSTDIDLKKTLQNMGVVSAFEDSLANFSSLTNDQLPLVVSDMEHAARLKIDEEGIEAAAFTMTEMKGTSVSIDKPLDFKVDRPFIFVLTSHTGSVLFVGLINQL